MSGGISWCENKTAGGHLSTSVAQFKNKPQFNHFYACKRSEDQKCENAKRHLTDLYVCIPKSDFQV